MKLNYVYITLALSLFGLVACEDDKDKSPENTQEYMEALSRGSEAATYELSKVDIFRREYDSNKGWEEVNPMDYIGLYVDAPENLTIYDGRTWIPLELFSPVTGPDELELPLRAYRLQTGFDKDFYIASLIDYNAEEGTMKIDGMPYTVLSASASNLDLQLIHQFVQGGTDKRGEFRYDLYYEHKSFSLPDMGKILFYDSELEAKLAIIEMLRARFGNVFNLNDYLGGDVILDDPIVDLDEIESRIREEYS